MGAASFDEGAPLAGPAPKGSPAETGLARCLGSVRHLAGASSACLVHQETLSGRTRVFAQAPPVVDVERIAQDVAVLLDQVAVEAITSRKGVWAGEDGSTLVARLDFRAETSRWLLLHFQGLGDALRKRAEAGLPDYAAILLSMLDATEEGEMIRTAERAMAAVLDQQDCGVVVLRQDGTVLLKNAIAAAILKDGVIMQTPRGSLRPAGYHDAVRFQTAVDCVVAARQQDGAKTRPHGMIMLLKGPTNDDERAVIAVLTPIHPDGGAPSGTDAAATLYLMRPDQSGARGLEPICQLHGLSPVETRLVSHLVAGLTVSDAAVEMRIKPDTARAYLKQVFAKTNTHRQSSLVRIITRYQRALRGDFDFRIA